MINARNNRDEAQKYNTYTAAHLDVPPNTSFLWFILFPLVLPAAVRVGNVGHWQAHRWLERVIALHV